MKVFKNLRQKFSKFDLSLVFLVYLLCTISTIFIYSATRSMYYLKHNLFWIGIGTIFIVLSIFIDYRISNKYIKYIYILGILTLLFVKFFGKTTLGAKRWITLFGIQLQPSEFIKIIVIMVIASTIVRRFRKGINNIFDMAFCLLYVLPFLILIVRQPDLGTTLIILFAYACMLFLCDANIKPLIYIAVFVVLAAYPTYRYILSDYQKTRIEVFINPEKDIKNKGWHVSQSKISVGSGGLFGSGVFNGSQSRLKFLPEPQTDFIFSVISEETGFIGSVSIIVIYFLLIFKFISISKNVDDEYGRLIIYGISGIFLGHTIINIGMTIGLIPVTGKTLLFLSYGGSSYISSFMMISLIESIKVYSNDM